MPRSLACLVAVAVAALCLGPAVAAATTRSAPGPAASATPLAVPLLVDPNVSLADQFGYTPDYPGNVPTFDPLGFAAIRSRNASQNDTAFVARYGGSGWSSFSLLDALRLAYPDFAGTVGAGGYATDRVVFDSAGRAYTLLTIRLLEGDYRNVILYSLDDCLTWQVRELPFSDGDRGLDGHLLGNIACETFSGHNPLQGPPFIAAWQQLGNVPGGWATRNLLCVLQPYFSGEDLVIPQPVPVSDRFLGMVQAAGGSSFAVTEDGRTTFVWAAVSGSPQHGTPIYASVYDQATHAVAAPVLLCRAQPGNDSHDTPAICSDSQGYLHVVVGAHNHSFLYLRSLLPADASAWTSPVKTLTSGWIRPHSDADGVGLQSYVSLVCDSQDVLHLVSRQMRRGVDAQFGGARWVALVHQQLRPGGVWEPPTLIAGCLEDPGYANFYQKLVVGPHDALYLSFNIFVRDGGAVLRPDRRFRQRIVLASDDHAVSWHFAGDADFSAAAAP